MALGKSAARSRLQISLELDGPSFLGEFEADDNLPGPTCDCVRTLSCVVRADACFDVRRQSGVIAIWL
jgi:hypothetical protein